LVEGHIFQIFLYVQVAQFVQHGERKIPEVHFRIDGIMLMKIFKEKPQVIGISQPGPRGSVVLDSAEESLAERRQGLQHSPHF
jgi:hypothetical protein